MSRELSPPTPLNRDDTLSLIQDQIRLSHEQGEATRKRERKEDAAKLDKEIETARAKFSAWEAKRVRERIEDAKKLRKEKEATRAMLNKQREESETKLEQQEADWFKKFTILQTQLDEEKALRNGNLDDLHRVSRQHYRQTSLTHALPIADIANYPPPHPYPA